MCIRDRAIEGRFLFALLAWFIVHLDFLSLKEFLRARHVRIFLIGHLLFSKRVGHLKAKDHSRGVIEYSLTGRYSTPSKKE